MTRNKKYTANKKNGGIIPPVFDERTLYVPRKCGNCIECRKQKAREWQVRLLEDIKENKNGYFITLTFSNESINELHTRIREDEKKRNQKDQLEGYDLDKQIATEGMRLFLERWRKKYKKSIRHWMVTEIGHNGTENIHLHGIIWTDIDVKEITRIWKYGYVWDGQKMNSKTINYVNAQTINYIVKYITKIDPKHKTFKPKILTSDGIGGNFTKRNMGNWENNKFNEEKTIETYRTETGHKIAMPIYWRNKIYTEEEREKLWIIKLNKEERWICGEKVDISKGEEEYYKLLKYYQKKNIQLGYGTGKEDWNRKIYENERRKLMIITRIEKAKGKLLETTLPKPTEGTDNDWKLFIEE